MHTLDDGSRRRWYALAGPALLAASIQVGGAGCVKATKPAKEKADALAPRGLVKERTAPPQKRPPAPVGAISLEQCHASSTGDRVTLEGYVRFSGDLFCGKKRCSVGLLPRAEARGGSRASVKLPITKLGGKLGVVRPKPGFMPGDLVIYDVTGKRVRIGQPVRATGTLRLMDAKKGYKVLCRIDAERFELIPRVTSPMHPAPPKRVPIASPCKGQPDGAYVRVQGFPKVPVDLNCINTCGIPFYEKAGHAGAQANVKIVPGKGPNRIRAKPPSLVGRDGATITPNRPVVVIGTLYVDTPYPSKTNPKPTPTCEIEAERFWQAKR
jgi:hypothetical protein